MFKNIEEIKKRNAEIGHHFFEPGTMAFFGSRIEDVRQGSKLADGRFFVTSEQDKGLGVRAWDGKRRYTVRMAMPDGSIKTIGGHGRFDTLSEARAFVAGVLTKEIHEEVGHVLED